MNGLITKAVRFVGQRVSEAGQWLLKDSRFWAHIAGGRKTVSSEQVDEEAALNYSAVWAATRLLCGTCSSLPLPLYRGLVDEDREKDRQHPAYRILNGLANPEMPATAFRSLMWQWQVNRGNAFAEIVREGDEPGGKLVALWPIHPLYVRLTRDEFDDMVYEVRIPGREPVFLPPWRMFHVPSIITHDGIVGHGVIEHARESVGVGIAMEKYGANWFGNNGGVPRIVISHPGKPLEGTAKQAFHEEWEALYSGPEGRKVAELGGDAKVVPLSLSAEDSQFLETRQFNIEEIARWYGVPPHLLQHLLRATYNNVENLGLDFVKYSLLPWLKIWEQAIWHKLLTEQEQAEYFAEHNVDALLRGDSASRAALYHQGINDGWLTRNEVRKTENLPPAPGGDTFLVQGAIVPLDEDGRPPQKTEAATGLPAPKPNEEAESIRASTADSVRRILKRDLRRLLTKESNAVLHAAKKDAGFVHRVDEFYQSHQLTVSEVIAEPIEALRKCGVNIDAAEFSVTWARVGKSAVLEASGSVTTGEELSGAVQRLVESNSWTERPEMVS